LLLEHGHELDRAVGTLLRPVCAAHLATWSAVVLLASACDRWTSAAMTPPASFSLADPFGSAACPQVRRSRNASTNG
jgi:hypothetical protein